MHDKSELNHFWLAVMDDWLNFSTLCVLFIEVRAVCILFESSNMGGLDYIYI
jgi:hypothetical protein